MDNKNLIDRIQEWLHLKSQALNEGIMEPPIPAELFTADQMERYGITLALSHHLTEKPVKNVLLRHLSNSEATLIKSYKILTKGSTSQDEFSPGREWILDNFYIIQEKINAIRRHLPKSYGRTLPQLANGMPGYPRIYDIALQIIAHSDGSWDLKALTQFITSYQGVTKLTLGELWAIPITLGVALIENLSNSSKQIVADLNDRIQAGLWADRMIEGALSTPNDLVTIIANMARTELRMSSAFIAELTRRLQTAALSLPLNWIEQHLEEKGLTIEQLVNEENKHRASTLVTVSNSISGLRLLNEINWCDFVEEMSIIEQTLKLDPIDIYRKMDFETRDRYRQVVERLSRSSLKSEEEVAKAAIHLAKTQKNKTEETENTADPEIIRYCHVGYYLIDKGLSELQKALGMRRYFWKNPSRQLVLLSYLGCITLITFGLTAALLFVASHDEISRLGLLLLGIVLVICISQLAVMLVNLGSTLLVKPKALPRMDFQKGIPASYQTLVAVPAMLGNIADIESLVRALEIRFLGNRDNHLHFALLTDFNDAPNEHMPEDEKLLNLVATRMSELNTQYTMPKGDIFFLFHRPRQWNEVEGVWMGRERKRGKLEDLNNFLRKNDQQCFSLILGRTDSITHIKYVITLDSDTQLPRESARKLVGTMSHPLNRPHFDAQKKIVMEGYGILQPRIAEAYHSPGPTRYVRLCGNEFGIDPYTRSVSDVYQDVFHEGSFIGKGIYDVDLFQQVLGNRLPSNCILSHDLLEGCYMRSGFLSDVVLYEKSPSSYLSDVKRRIRWIRGDWQIAGWLFPTVSNGGSKHVPNPLSFLSKYKLFDNLRRSLVAPALLLLFGLNWIFLPQFCVWLGIILAIVALPSVITTLIALLQKPIHMLHSRYFINIMLIIRHHTAQLIFYLACLPHEAWSNVSAILRTAWRMNISKKHLLEWVPSDQVDQRLHDTRIDWIKSLWMGPITAFIAMMILVVHDRVECLLFASPLLILWFTSPLIARWLSRPFKAYDPKLDSSQIRFLHRKARKTWNFFDTYITAENHWLPPDNYQEAPVVALAQRTSPTNIGLALLANLTAYDFGYINMTQLLERTSNTMKTMSKLEKYRGHLYNWYNTETLSPLFPRYISTVDSGNLAGHLLTLRQGLLALIDAPLLNPRYLDGLEDTLEVLVTTAINSQAVTLALDHFQRLLQDARSKFTSWSDALSYTENLLISAKYIHLQSTQANAVVNEISEWSNKLLFQCQALHNEIKLFFITPQLPANATLREIALLTSNDDGASQTKIEASHKARSHIELIDALAAQAYSLVQMDISFLYDEASHLMTIGFNVDEQRRDSGNYDLLCSEARLGSFVAIAQGQVQQDSWFALGRLMVSSGGEPILISWSGSMFEYLMPLLVMPTYPGTLLDQTYHAAIKRQIAYGKQHGVPWGVSESGYNAYDVQFNYLYRAFGVPELGLKRGLEDDLVIAPYASAMALMVAPKAACLNLERLAAEYATGRFGFYEAIDYTLARLPRDEKKRALVRSFMTHHQGMIFLAFSHFLHNQPMQKRFEADPTFQATLQLLQERVPKPTFSYLKIPKVRRANVVSNPPEDTMRVFNTPNTRTPQVQLLSNGRYHLVLTQAGGGYSRWKDISVTRWREDSTSDNWGMFCYLRDVATGEFCSTHYQPTTGSIKNFRAVFSEAHAEFSRESMQLDMHTEVIISPEDDIELRRIRVHNRAKNRRTIEFTSYAEIVLAPQSADLSQPAFSNLFIETELLSEQQAILATRRPREDKETPPWLCHLLNVYSEHSYTLSFETDRSLFIGRGRTLAEPLALLKEGDLSNTKGAVLDPIVAIRCRLTLEPDTLILFDLLTGVADNRDQCVSLIEKHRDQRLTNRIFELAWTHSQVLLNQLNISEADAQLYGRLASALIYSSRTRRAEPRILSSNRQGQSSLWRYSISGDFPIVLLFIENSTNIELVQKLIQAQNYLRRKGLIIDLVILTEEHVSYIQTLHDQIMSLISANASTTSAHTGCIVLRTADLIPIEDKILFESVARVILSDKRGTLREQLSRRPVNPPLMPLLRPSRFPHSFSNNQLPPLPRDLQFFNGLGGFTSDGDEYIIRLVNGASTPAPWANVLANPNFGSLVSESGQGYTWTENAHEFRLTPWDNDPLQDTSGEGFYLRDDETGYVWSPTALPCRGYGDYQTRHGFGYSVFEHIEDGIHSELWIYVASDAPVKFFVLKIRNDSTQKRQLSATGFITWVLGDLRCKNAMHIVTELSSSGALLAQNHYNTDFGDRTAFFDATTSHIELNERTMTGDRTEFLGRNGTQQKPAALERMRLSGRVGAGFDPCGAIQLAFNLAKGKEREIVFILGVGQNKLDADRLVQRYHSEMAAKAALASVRQYWQQTLSITQVTTPDPAVNFLANGWLLYQVLSSRLWGRSGYYQSSGAFGFRDQLQDVMSLSHVAPKLFRTHILLCAAHQFEEGDVQHWWHPPHNRGVRTRCSDDYLWLPFAICKYIETTGDIKVLDEVIPFLQGRPLKPEEESYYELPTMGTTGVSLYQHAVHAIRNGLKFGEHGLPLMGSGDWNDGMNMVGIEGRGESVWLAFFLYDVLKHFAPIAKRYGDNAFATLCDEERGKLQKHIETHGWDGEWYLRAYFDDGTPLGSQKNTECQIDSIAQSWSVLSGAADPSRSKEAMAAVKQYLVNFEAGVIKLLDPAFNKSKPNPGYIEGYVPGIRENGGQYTHAAIWATMAFAALGEKNLAWKLFNIVNPINHAQSMDEMKRYKIEPYVIAGDVYSVIPHMGRGGWSWYTGSAGWLYRLITETLLGLQLEEGNRLRLSPLLPDGWDSFKVDYTYGSSMYKITVKRTSGKDSLILDEVQQNGNVIPLLDDGRIHNVNLTINS